MTFEDFEKVIATLGFGIVAMNHYSMNGKRYLYCAILNGKTNTAFRSEGEESRLVFDDLIHQIEKEWRAR